MGQVTAYLVYKNVGMLVDLVYVKVHTSLICRRETRVLIHYEAILRKVSEKSLVVFERVVEVSVVLCV